mgnify:CR=1
MSIRNFLFIYRWLSRLYFHLPVFFLFLLSKDVSLFYVPVLLAVYPISIFLMSLVKNKINYNPKLFLLLSFILNCIGYTIILWSPNFIWLVYAQLLLGAAYAVAAGEDSKLLFASDYSLNEKQEIQTKSNSLMFIALLLSGVVGGYVYTIEPTYNFILAIIANILSLLFALLLNDECAKKPPKKTSTAGMQPVANDMPATFHDYLYYSLTRGVVLGVFVGLIPFVLLKQNITPLVFAAVLSSYTLSGFASSQFFNKIPFKPRLLKKLSVSLIFFGTLLLIFFNQNLASIVLALVLYGLGTGLVRPLTMGKIKNPIEINKLEKYFSLTNIVVLLIMPFLY